MSDLVVTTNNVPRELIDGFELDAKERAEFGYLDWQAIDHDEDSATFIRYRGELYDFAEFTPPPATLPKWQGIRPDSYFHGVLIRFADSYCETVIVGRYYVS